ncbi:hypothetical protein PIB30_068754, partial [Stylosanthes scabra]|nr:hypothetical protein [Stylosanthes scabra]
MDKEGMQESLAKWVVLARKKRKVYGPTHTDAAQVDACLYRNPDSYTTAASNSKDIIPGPREPLSEYQPVHISFNSQATRETNFYSSKENSAAQEAIPGNCSHGICEYPYQIAGQSAKDKRLYGDKENFCDRLECAQGVSHASNGYPYMNSAITQLNTLPTIIAKEQTNNDASPPKESPEHIGDQLENPSPTIELNPMQIDIGTINHVDMNQADEAQQTPQEQGLNDCDMEQPHVGMAMGQVGT